MIEFQSSSRKLLISFHFPNSAIMSAEPAYKAISRRKLAELDSKIPEEWRLPARWIPPGMLSPEESITNTSQYQSVNVLDIPRRCGLLSPRQLDITEKWDIKGLLEEMKSGRLTAKEVCESFCKVRSCNEKRYNFGLWLIGLRTACGNCASAHPVPDGASLRRSH